MDIIEFTIASCIPPYEDEYNDYVSILINGDDLVDLAHQCDLKYDAASEKAYESMHPLGLHDYLTRDIDNISFICAKGKRVVLTCSDCGCELCCSLAVKITIQN